MKGSHVFGSLFLAHLSVLVGAPGVRAFIPKLSMICNVIFVRFLFWLCAAIVSHGHRQLVIIKCLVTAVDFILLFLFPCADVVFVSASCISCAHSKSFSFFVGGRLRMKEVLLDFRTRLSSYAFVPFIAVLCVLYYIIVRNVQCIIAACSCSIPRLCAETGLTSLGEHFSKGPMLWMRGFSSFTFFF